MRLIDADALIKNWERDRGRMFDADYFIFTIEHAPAIDAVPRADYEELERHFVNWEPVVRCKDCKWHQDNATWEDFINHCKWISTETPDDDDFCSCGERKDNEIDRR